MIDFKQVYYHSQIYNPLLQSQEPPASHKPEHKYVKAGTQKSNGSLISAQIERALSHQLVR